MPILECYESSVTGGLVLSTSTAGAMLKISVVMSHFLLSLGGIDSVA